MSEAVEEAINYFIGITQVHGDESDKKKSISYI